MPDRQKRLDVVSEAELRSVIERAIQLDIAQKGISVADVRSIASEVGITDGAINAALAEMDIAEDVSLPLPTGAKRVGSVLSALTLGVMSGLFVSFPYDYRFYWIKPSMAVVAVVSILSLRICMPERKMGRFQLLNAAAWLGYIVGWELDGLLSAAMGSHNPVPWITLARFAMYGGVSAVIGWILMVEPSTLGYGTPSAARPTLMTRVYEKAKAIKDIILEFKTARLKHLGSAASRTAFR